MKSQLGPFRRRRVRLIDILDEAATGIIRRPGRSALTALGTVLGVGTFVTTFALASTASAQISDQFDALKATEVTLIDLEPDRDDAAFPADTDLRLGSLNGVIAGGVSWSIDDPAASLRLTPIPDPRGRNTIDAPLVAATPGLIAAARPTFTAGAGFSAPVDSGSARVALLGSATAQRLAVTDLDQRPAVFIGNIPFTVIGIIGDVERSPDLLLSVIIPAAISNAVEHGDL
ncbi:MAG: ABC transporter permease, partial [Acidimicrobiia bacterium]